jgi:hypothetical protein
VINQKKKMSFTGLPLNGQNTLSVYSGPNSVTELESVPPDQILKSQTSQYFLILRADGLTIWSVSQLGSLAGTPIWGPTPWKPGVAPGSQALKAVIEPDGNFVVYDTNGTPLWWTDTGPGHPGAYVVMEDNATRGGRPGALLVIYDSTDLPLWASDSQASGDLTSWNTVLGSQQYKTTAQGAGVMGVSHDNYGVFGYSKINDAVHGESDGDGAAVAGIAKGNGDGVHGENNGTGAAVAGIARSSGPAGFFNGDVKITGNTTLSSFNFSQPSTGHVSSSAFAFTVTNDQNGAISAKGNVAGHFEGNLEVTGDIKLINADCAEEFDSATDTVEPGTVMVLNQSGSIEQSSQAYDKKVAGIVSGAGNYKTALILDKRTDSNNTSSKRVPIALMGKVYCKVDATRSSIEIGDLLTSSPKKGHAMKAEDPFKAFGAVIGKALEPLKGGIAMIPVLVALQ